jgi:hypothetical protein
MMKWKKMKKIKSIRQLKAEQKKLRQQQKAAERDVKEKWDELKELLKPGALAKDAFKSTKEDKAAANGTNGESVWKSTLNYGISLLAKKFSEKASEKIGGFFSKKAK